MRSFRWVQCCSYIQKGELRELHASAGTTKEVFQTTLREVGSKIQVLEQGSEELSNKITGIDQELTRLHKTVVNAGSRYEDIKFQYEALAQKLEEIRKPVVVSQ